MILYGRVLIDLLELSIYKPRHCSLTGLGDYEGRGTLTDTLSTDQIYCILFNKCQITLKV